MSVRELSFIWQSASCYMDRWSHIRNGFRYSVMLCNETKRHGYGVHVSETHFQKRTDHSGHLGGYCVGNIGAGALFEERRANELWYLHQSGVERVGTPVLWEMCTKQGLYDLDGRWGRLSYLHSDGQMETRKRAQTHELAGSVSWSEPYWKSLADHRTLSTVLKHQDYKRDHSLINFSDHIRNDLNNTHLYPGCLKC